MIDFERKEHYGLSDLLRIVALLRSEDGCPWDRVQTHASLRRSLLEEAYEAAEAIDREDPALLKEELGDLLLQVVFHADIERQAGDCWDNTRILCGVKRCRFYRTDYSRNFCFYCGMGKLSAFRR